MSQALYVMKTSMRNMLRATLATYRPVRRVCPLRGMGSLGLSVEHVAARQNAFGEWGHDIVGSAAVVNFSYNRKIPRHL